MYDAEFIDVIDEVLDGDDAEAFSAASKTVLPILCIYSSDLETS